MSGGFVGKWSAAQFSPNNQVQKYLTLLACENAQEGKGEVRILKTFLNAWDTKMWRPCGNSGAWEPEVLEASMKDVARKLNVGNYRV